MDQGATPTETLAEALCGSMPSTVGLVQQLVSGQSPVAMGLPVKVQGALGKIIEGNSVANGKVAQHIVGSLPSVAGKSMTQQMVTGGLISKEAQENMERLANPLKAHIEQMSVAPAWFAQVKKPLEQSLFPLIGARMRAQMSPALGGTFQPSAERVAGLQKAFAEIGVAGSARAPIKMPGVQVVPASLRALQDPALPVRREQPAVIRPVVRPEVLPDQVEPQTLGEVFGQGLMRAYRQEAEELLNAVGLELELEHLQSIELRLRTGKRSDRLQAALSASLLLKGLADHLFPPRQEKLQSRFGKTHELGSENVSNRLSAFVDPVFRSKLSSKEHYLFQATVDVVFRWSGEGHHVIFTPREAAEAFCQLLKVLADIARVHRAAGA